MPRRVACRARGLRGARRAGDATDTTCETADPVCRLLCDVRANLRRLATIRKESELYRADAGRPINRFAFAYRDGSQGACAMGRMVAGDRDVSGALCRSRLLFGGASMHLEPGRDVAVQLPSLANCSRSNDSCCANSSGFFCFSASRFCSFHRMAGNSRRCWYGIKDQSGLPQTNDSKN